MNEKQVQARDQNPRLYGLTRASTLKQADSPATQREIMATACKTLALGEPTWLDEPLATSGRSKKFAQRPMGNWILRNLRRGDTLVTTKVDRLGRSLRDIYDTVDTLFHRGVNVVILHGWGGRIIDLSNATDRIFLLILAWFSEYEGERIAARTREGLEHRRRNGLSTGKKLFTYIQAFSACGEEIPRGEYSKAQGHYKINLPDRAWLDQLCELLTLQKHLGVRGEALVNYCRQRKFTNRAGKEWWNGTVYHGRSGDYTVSVVIAMKKVRTLAVRGELPEEYNDKILAITGDTPATVAPKWKRKPAAAAPPPLEPTPAEMDAWDAATWRQWYEQRAIGDE